MFKHQYQFENVSSSATSYSVGFYRNATSFSESIRQIKQLPTASWSTQMHSRNIFTSTIHIPHQSEEPLLSASCPYFLQRSPHLSRALCCRNTVTLPISYYTASSNIFSRVYVYKVGLRPPRLSGSVRYLTTVSRTTAGETNVPSTFPEPSHLLTASSIHSSTTCIFIPFQTSSYYSILPSP